MGHGSASTTDCGLKCDNGLVAISTQRLAVWTVKVSRRRRFLECVATMRGRRVKGRKRHILLDTLGLLLAVVVTSAAVSDPAGARLLLRRLAGACKKLRRIWVDGTYRGHLLEWVMLHFHFVLQPVLRPEGQKGFVLLPRRSRRGATLRLVDSMSASGQGLRTAASQ
jgi:hypothetical protein